MRDFRIYSGEIRSLNLNVTMERMVVVVEGQVQYIYRGGAVGFLNLVESSSVNYFISVRCYGMIYHLQGSRVADQKSFGHFPILNQCFGLQSPKLFINEIRKICLLVAINQQSFCSSLQAVAL